MWIAAQVIRTAAKISGVMLRAPAGPAQLKKMQSVPAQTVLVLTRIVAQQPRTVIQAKTAQAEPALEMLAKSAKTIQTAQAF